MGRLTLKKLKKKMVKVKPVCSYYSFVTGRFTSEPQRATFPRPVEMSSALGAPYIFMTTDGTVEGTREMSTESECKATWEYLMYACKTIQEEHVASHSDPKPALMAGCDCDQCKRYLGLDLPEVVNE